MTETEYKEVPIEENENCDGNEVLKCGYGVRHIQIILFFLCLSMSYTSRGHLGVTIVGMTTVDVSEELNANVNTTVFIDRNTSKINSNKLNSISHSQDNIWSVYRIYSWSKSEQELVHGSFLLGYTIMMLPMGILSHRWGGKIALQVAMIVNALVSFFTPWVIAWGSWQALCVCRLLQGLFQAGVFPGVQTLLANWVPISERSSLSSYVYTGVGFGTVLGYQLAGIMASSRFGWPSTFWIIGAICFIVFILITFFGAATPTEYRNISQTEKNFITGKVPCVQQNVKIPWKSVLSSMPVWSTFIAHIGSILTFVFYLIQLPTYMYAILKLDIRSNGILSSLPYIATMFFCIAFGLFSDFLINRNIITIRSTRILTNSIGSFIPALCCVLVSYTTNTALTVFYFVASFAANSAIHSGFMVNYMDLSPNFAGALMATGNTMANIIVLFLPIMVSNVVIEITNQYQWRIILFLMAGLSTVSNIFFIAFMSADVQTFNGPILKGK